MTYERFTDRARVVLQLAKQEAQRLSHEYVATEHLLLGLAKEGGGIAAQAIKNLDVDLRKIREETEKVIQKPHGTLVLELLPMTPVAKACIEHAIREASSLHHNCVGTEHLLLGLLQEPASVAGMVLQRLGLTVEKIREEVVLLIGHHDEDKPGTVLNIVFDESADATGKTFSTFKYNHIVLDLIPVDSVVAILRKHLDHLKKSSRTDAACAVLAIVKEIEHGTPGSTDKPAS